jgi:hypothetical protein
MKKLIFISVLSLFIMSTFVLDSYSQSVELSKDNPYKGERIRITGKGWQPQETITFEIIQHGPAYSGMVLTTCGETVAYDDGSFGGSCLIPANLGYYSVDFYVNGLLAGQLRAR